MRGGHICTYAEIHVYIYIYSFIYVYCKTKPLGNMFACLASRSYTLWESLHADGASHLLYNAKVISFWDLLRILHLVSFWRRRETMMLEAQKCLHFPPWLLCSQNLLRQQFRMKSVKRLKNIIMVPVNLRVVHSHSCEHTWCSVISRPAVILLRSGVFSCDHEYVFVQCWDTISQGGMWFLGRESIFYDGNQPRMVATNI